MQWRKLGRIFNPFEHVLPGCDAGFAQSPQAVVMHDRVRIYFSARMHDTSNGKFLSQPAFADFSTDLRTVLGVNTAPVMPPGELGCFDEHGIFPFSPTIVGDEIWAYTTGWSRRVSVSVETAIGLAISRDGGLSFERAGPGPVLGASLHEPCLVGDAFVRRFNGVFHMWTMFGIGWKHFPGEAAPDRIYKIGHATSMDGIHWTKEEGHALVPDRLGDDECQALPSVIRVGERYLMAFCYREACGFRADPSRGYRLGQAWSDDLVTWTRSDDLPHFEREPGAWDSDMVCYPHLVEIDDRIVLLYNGNAFGREGFGAAVLEQPMRFALGEADSAQLRSHLQAVDSHYVPPLSSRVDLAAYADKLVASAQRIEAWEGTELVGCIAMYVDAISDDGFISNVSVLPRHQGRGLAGELLKRNLALSAELGLKRIRLEVHNENAPALALYRSHGFLPVCGTSSDPNKLLERVLQ